MARRRSSRRRGSRRQPDWIDRDGRKRSPKGFLRGKTKGMTGDGPGGFRRVFYHLPWFPDWDWKKLGLKAGVVYGFSRATGFAPLTALYSDRRYHIYAGIDVPDYDGPYLVYNAVRAARRRGVDVPDWARMRSGGRSHRDQRIQKPGYGGMPPDKGWDMGTWLWGRDG